MQRVLFTSVFSLGLRGFLAKVSAAAMVLFFLSCDDKPVDLVDFLISSDPVFVGLGSQSTIYIGSGNKEYSIESGDTDLIHAQVDLTTGAAGSIRITGLRKGSTSLTIRDHMSGQETALRIYVVDPFLVMRAGHVVGDVVGVDQDVAASIRAEMHEYAPIGFGDFLLFQANEEQRFSVFADEISMKEGTVKQSGTYSLLLDYGGPHRLRMDYDGDTESLEVPIHVPNEQVFSRLWEFVQHLQPEEEQDHEPTIELKADIRLPQATSFVDPYYFLLYQDMTSHFRQAYPALQRADLFQQISLYPESGSTWIAERILAPAAE